MRVLTPEEIKQPTGGLIIETERNPKDWVKDDSPMVGAIVGGKMPRVILCPKKDWREFITEMQVQMNGIFNDWSCVTHTMWNKIQCLGKCVFNIILDESKRYTSVKSGTKPREGNTVTNVCESIRKLHGGVHESIYPSLRPDMTESEFYASIPAAVDAQENFLNQGWEYFHEWVKTYDGVHATISELSDSLQYSPIAVSVGNYYYDENGYLYAPNTPNYIHECLIVTELPDCFLILDSQNGNNLLRYRKDYPFGWPKIGYLQKKTMINPKIYKKKGEPALYALNPEQNVLVPFGDGYVLGGSLFKTLYGTESYKEVPRVKDDNGEDWEVLPYPIAKYLFTTTPVNGAVIEE